MRNIFFVFCLSICSLVMYADTYVVDNYKGKPYVKGTNTSIHKNQKLSDSDVVCFQQGECISLVNMQDDRLYVFSETNCHSIAKIVESFRKNKLFKTIWKHIIKSSQKIVDARDCKNIGSTTLGMSEIDRIESLVVSKIAYSLTEPIGESCGDSLVLKKVKTNSSKSYYMEIVNNSSRDMNFNVFKYDKDNNSIHCCFQEYACCYVPTMSTVAYEDILFSSDRNTVFFIVGAPQIFDARVIEQLYNERYYQYLSRDKTNALLWNYLVVK